MLQRSTIQLLRFHFSFFLLPVYLFALSQVPQIHTARALLVFMILHLLVYPSSNGYNSYMDRDEGSIGGIRNPMQPTRQLFYTSVAMDIIAVLLGGLVSIVFATGIVAYILASRAYSYRGIRLKQYPVTGYLTVVIFQGAVTFFLVYHGSSENLTIDVPVTGMVASSLLIGGFYPLTQIYQHEADRKDGVRTISSVLGYRGTFFLTGIMYVLAMGSLFHWFSSRHAQINFVILATVMLPVIVYFFIWFARVWKQETAASFANTMRMNILASVCTNVAFLILLIRR